MATAAAALVDCAGSLSSVKAAEYLCLYQSCQARARLLSDFQASAAPRNRQRLCLQRLQQLQQAHLLAAGHKIEHTVALEFLNSHCQAWRMADCSPTFAASVAALPQGCRLLVLQRSPDQRSMYTAVVWKPTDDDVSAAADKAAAAAAAAGDEGFDPSTVAPPVAMAVVRRTALDAGQRVELGRLTARVRKFQASTGKFLMNYGEDAGREGDLLEAGINHDQPNSHLLRPGGAGHGTMASMVSHGGNTITTMRSQLTAGGRRVDRMETEFTRLLVRTEAALEPALNDGAVKAALAAATTVVLLPDAELSVLPLEGMPCLSNATAVSRDFSLAMLTNRRFPAAPIGSLAAGGGDDGAADVSPAPSNAALASLAYVVDPRAEDRAPDVGDGQTPRRTLSQAVQDMEAAAGAKSWRGAGGTSGHIPSTGDWQRSLLAAGRAPTNDGAFLFLGPGRLLGHVPPSAVAGLSLPSCRYVTLVGPTSRVCCAHALTLSFGCCVLLCYVQGGDGG